LGIVAEIERGTEEYSWFPRRGPRRYRAPPVADTKSYLEGKCRQIVDSGRCTFFDEVPRASVCRFDMKALWAADSEGELEIIES
jgi:hypothetical protein